MQPGALQNHDPRHGGPRRCPGPLAATPATARQPCALAAQGHSPTDTQAFADTRQQLGTFNTTQNTNQNAALELTDENVKVGNALWEYIVDMLATGTLMYKETQPKKAKTFSMATLLKRIHKENGTGGVKPEPEKV